MAKKQAGLPIEIIPDVTTIGLFKSTLKSRKRLRITALLVIILFCAAFAGMGYFLKHISEWPIINIILLIILMGGVILGGYVLALAIGDTLFHGPWREKMRLGNKFVPENVDDQAALLKNKNIYFIIAWLISIILLFAVSDLASGRAITWYSSCGSILSSMRSSDPVDRKLALESLSNPLRMKAWNDTDIRSQVVTLIDDTDNDVAALAEYMANRALISEAADALIKNAKDTTRPEHVRSEAITALGKLNWKQARGGLITLLNQEFEKNHKSEEIVPALLFAFFDMAKDKAAEQPVRKILETCYSSECSDEILQYAFFYIKSIEAKQDADLAFKYIDNAAIPLKTRCLAADSLRFISEPKHIPELKLRFDRTPKEDECEEVFRKYHKEAAIIFFENFPMRALFVRAVGHQERKADYDWIWLIGSDETENIYTRKAAEQFAKYLSTLKK